MKPALVAASMLGLAGLLPASASALEAYGCRNGLFPQLQGLQLATATPGASGKVYFRNDDKGCPQQASCVGKAYVVAGDTLLVSPPTEGWVCAWYFSKKQEYVGWIRAEEAKPEPTRVPTPADWTGDWSSHADIKIERNADGSLHVTGTAFWYGLKVRGYQVVHDGEIDDSAKPVGNRLEIGDPKDEYACRVVFTLVDGYLLADDSGYCGGMNVSFTDVYRRAAAKKSAPRK